MIRYIMLMVCWMLINRIETFYHPGSNSAVNLHCTLVGPHFHRIAHEIHNNIYDYGGF